MKSESLFNCLDRKKIVCSILRKIIKESHLKFKLLDPVVHDYVLLDVRKNFDKQKTQVNLRKISSKVSFGEKVLEDLKKIKIDYKDGLLRVEDPSITQCNYIVTIF
jgi:hypothetical protein